jgi:hypothetical protein
MLVGIFFLALFAQVDRNPHNGNEFQSVPIFGIKVDPIILWAAAPLVLGTILRATLGTFDAYAVALEHVGEALESGRSYEYLDTSPNALDFMVYRRGATRPRIMVGYLSYPITLSAVFLEGWWLLIRYSTSTFTAPADTVLLILGAAALVWCVPRLTRLWASKIGKMIGKEVGRSA